MVAVKALGKQVPVLREILAVRDEIFGTIEMSRVRRTLEEIERRVGSLEVAMNSGQRAQIVVYGCDQARHDILFDGKAAEYGGAIGYLATRDVELNEVVEVLDSLRHLSVDDLRVLYQFKSAGQVFENRQVAELAGWTGYNSVQMNVFSPARASDNPLRATMERIFPSLMRLQGLGVLFLADESRTTGGRIPPEIGGLTSVLRQFVYLTQIGKRLLQALPGNGAA